MTSERSEPTVLPAGLRERVLEASRQARAVGRSVPEVMEISLRRRSVAWPTLFTGCCARWATTTGGYRYCVAWTCKAWSVT